MSSDFYENVPEVVKVKSDKFKELTAQGKYPYKECRFEYNAFCKILMKSLKNTTARK